MPSRFPEVARTVASIVSLAMPVVAIAVMVLGLLWDPARELFGVIGVGSWASTCCTKACLASLAGLFVAWGASKGRPRVVAVIVNAVTLVLSVAAFIFGAYASMALSD